MKSFYKIAIDGPAGSGKSTIAKLLAKKIGYLYIDSGAMYRALTLCFIEKDLKALTDLQLKKYLKNLELNFLNKKGFQLIYLNGQNVTKQIRSIAVTDYVSEVSSKKIVRDELVQRQREFACESSIVMDGRDIGTTVFPDADLKLYLTASSLIRAKRRIKDFTKLNEKPILSKLILDIEKRDNYDSSRDISPLSKSQDAIVIDTSYISIKDVLDRIINFLPFQ